MASIKKYEGNNYQLMGIRKKKWDLSNADGTISLNKKTYYDKHKKRLKNHQGDATIFPKRLQDSKSIQHLVISLLFFSSNNMGLCSLSIKLCPSWNIDHKRPGLESH